ncbi:tyrosine-type recombinase/integrase [Streptomyces sp. NPDC059396]|uniref:tyrosine-type recombinase/integrase n=1 Tax=Streptomyces sp. NPDC059396 TaxID=3346819 RepID=UPI00369E8142
MPQIGRLEETKRAEEPYRLLAPSNVVVEPMAEWFAELQAASKPPTTIRSYGMDLLRWYRFLWTLEIPWDRATGADARNFARWLQLANKPVRLHWRYQKIGLPPGGIPRQTRPDRGIPNTVTGKAGPGEKYAPTTRAHCETVLRTFYDFHCDEGGAGPLIDPFPLDRSRRSRKTKAARPNAHHNPMEVFQEERKGRYRPTVPKRIPKRIPDELFNALFAAPNHNRDRALLAFWVSTGARRQGVPRGRNQTLRWTLRRPWRPLSYFAARAMFKRVNELLGSNWTLHDLWHTAAYRMARDLELSLTDIQWVLNHAHLSTTEIYLNPRELHQTGEKLQVAWSMREVERVRRVYGLAS